MTEEDLKTKFIILLRKVLTKEKTYKDILDGLTSEEKEAIGDGEVLEKIAEKLGEEFFSISKNYPDLGIEKPMNLFMEMQGLKNYIIQNLKHNDN